MGPYSSQISGRYPKSSTLPPQLRHPRGHETVAVAVGLAATLLHMPNSNSDSAGWPVYTFGRSLNGQPDRLLEEREE